MKLTFGYHRGLPADRTVAWGARLIVTQQGHVDFVPDRQDAIGAPEPRAQLLAHLNAMEPRLEHLIARLLRRGAMRTRVAQEFTLYADDVVVIKANTNASDGYCYVVAYFTQVAFEAERR